MNLVSDTLMQKNSSTSQVVTGQQLIEHIVVLPIPFKDYCPPGTCVVCSVLVLCLIDNKPTKSSGGYNLHNKQTLDMTTMVNMASINSVELADIIKSTIENEMNSAIKSQKIGGWRWETRPRRCNNLRLVMEPQKTFVTT